MLGAMTMAVRWCMGGDLGLLGVVKPVVPMTACTPSSRQMARWASVPSGRVKSISTSAFCSPGAGRR